MSTVPKVGLFSIIGSALPCTAYLTGMISIVHLPALVAIAAVAGGLSGYIVSTTMAEKEKIEKENPDPHQVIRELRYLIHKNEEARGKLGSVIDLASNVVDSLDDLLKTIENLESKGQIRLEARNKLEAIITRHFPTSIHKFLELPANFVMTVNGKAIPAKDILRENLKVLSKELDEVMTSIHAGTFEDLLVQCEFLADKYGK